MATSSTSLSLKEYLKKYETKNEEEKKKKKKKKNRKSKTDAMGVLVVDEDPVWQKPVELGEEDNSDVSADEEKPQVNEDIEVKRMKRLEQIRLQRPYDAISQDGSGWVSISDAPKHSNSSLQNPDMSPPRQRRTRYDTPSPEPEPKATSSGNGVSDLSPPRQQRRRFHTPSPESEQKLSKSISPDRDFSPPRRSKSQISSDFRRKQSERPDSIDLSPPRRVRPRSVEEDASVSQVEDLSPPRKGRKDRGMFESADLSPPRRIRRSSPDGVTDLSPPRKSKKDTSLKEGARSGLFTAQEIKKELDQKKKEELSRYKAMDPSMSGRGAEPVYRDKEGKRISKDELLKLEKGEEKPKEKKLEWGKGLAQKREVEAREHELELEKDKPFARTRDDPELDKMLKERVRWGDPMAHLVKRKHSELILEDLGENEKMKESGFLIPQDIPSHSWIKRGIDAPPNRYGIRPGRHWDGVDRSNGTEKEYYKRKNEKQASEREAYLWSVSDM